MEIILLTSYFNYILDNNYNSKYSVNPMTTLEVSQIIYYAFHYNIEQKINK